MLNSGESAWIAADDVECASSFHLSKIMKNHAPLFGEIPNVEEKQLRVYFRSDIIENVKNIPKKKTGPIARLKSPSRRDLDHALV
jgi:hypothetical protein